MSICFDRIFFYENFLKLQQLTLLQAHTLHDKSTKIPPQKKELDNDKKKLCLQPNAIMWLIDFWLARLLFIIFLWFFVWY